MKNFLYYIVILFNSIGAMISISLFFIINQFYFYYLPLIILSTLIFVVSVTVTACELAKKNKKVLYIYPKKSNVVDYREYFAKRKGEFTIAWIVLMV